eukprot:jgi/Botrbrau1/11924/Bobra.0259s0013.1
MEYSPSKLAYQASLLCVSPAHPYVRHAFVTVLRTFRMLIKSVRVVKWCTFSSYLYLHVSMHFLCNRHSMEYSPSKLAYQASLLCVSPAHPYVRHAFVTVLRTFRMLIKSVIVIMSFDIHHL